MIVPHADRWPRMSGRPHWLYTPPVTNHTPAPPAADMDPAEHADSDPAPGSLPGSAVYPGPNRDEHSGPGRIDAFVRRALACIAGLGLVVGFFLNWQQSTEINLESYTGLELALKGRTAIWAIPAVGGILIALGAWGRRPALLGSMLIGLALLLVGTWQTLTYLAQTIGPGLWITAGAAIVALLGGIPWQRMFRNARSD